MPVSDYDPIIDEAAREWNVDPNLLRAQMQRESAGKPNAVSSKGATGLMQIMPQAGADLGATDLNDPVQSIWASAKYMSQLLGKYQRPDLAVAAYNAGPDRVDAFVSKGTPLPKETLDYVPAVAANYAKLTPGAKASAAPGDMSDDDFLKSVVGTKPSPVAAKPGIPTMTIKAPDAGEQSDEDFLRNVVGTKPAPPSAPTAAPAPAPSQTLPTGDLPVDPNDPTTGEPLAMPGQGAFNRVANAATAGAREGFGNSPLGLSPQSQNALSVLGITPSPGNGGPIRYFNQALLNTLAPVGDLAMRTGAGLLGAYQRGVSQLGQEVGAPIAGREAAALPEAFAGSPNMLAIHTPEAEAVNPLASWQPGPGAPPRPAISAPSFVPPGTDVPQNLLRAPDRPLFVPPTAATDVLGNRVPIDPLANPLAGAKAPAAYTSGILPPGTPSPEAAPSVAPPSTGAARSVAPGTPPPGETRSVGAAASRELSEPGTIPPETPAQKATALQKMVNQSAEDRLTPQGRDDAVYVPGVERPEAMRDFSPAPEGQMSTALQHKVLYNTDSNYHDQFDALVKRNNDIMVDRLHDMFGDGNAREAAMENARELMPGPVGLFKGEQPVDAQPIVDKIQTILDGPAGKRGSVKSQLNSILPNLYDADGNLESMPSMLKGIRDDITDRLYDKTPTVEGNAARTARNQLQQVLGTVDNAIASGLPEGKYQAYLDNLSGALGQVSKLDFLQQYLTGPKKLTNTSGDLQFNKVQKLLDDIQAQAGRQTGGAKELTWPEITEIEAVRNELAAKDLLDKRANVRGSPTVQLANASGLLGEGPLGKAVKGAAELGAHAVLLHTTGGIGNAAMALHRVSIKPAMEAKRIQKQEAARAAIKTNLLNTAPNPDAAP